MSSKTPFEPHLGMLFVGLPASVGLCVVATPMVRAVFEGGLFSSDAKSGPLVVDLRPRHLGHELCPCFGEGVLRQRRSTGPSPHWDGGRWHQPVVEFDSDLDAFGRSRSLV